MHGTNDYTFLDYVNMRLVSIYLEDSVEQSGNRSARTAATEAAHYVQVTFTLGSQYEINANEDLIPRASVRAGKGQFFADVTLDHKCMEWAGEGTYPFDDQETYTSRLNQDCATKAAMCVSPNSIPDSFVVFNVPLGIDFFGDTSATQLNNVFVDMVVSAVDTIAAGVPQVQTTLTASIPVVEEGVNIFCDTLVGKSDLQDVADADIVVGLAITAEERARLKIIENITNTQFGTEAITQIDSDSIEAGLITLVLKGNSNYFAGTNTGHDEVTIELEDVITIHIMGDDAGSSSSKDAHVARLLAIGPDDYTDSNGLVTNGYSLNGAFYFTIDRSSQRAHLEPKSALTHECPFNPPRPAGGMTLETCVTRRDVRHRGFPARTGAMSTAMEVCSDGSSTVKGSTTCPAFGAEDSAESAFFTTMLGNNEYAKKLGSNHARAIAYRCNLDNRYRRAYFINPGYEWTPTQTGGTPIFSVSQKLYLFALISLDEGLTRDGGEPGDEVSLPTVRRKMLLQGTPSNMDEALQYVQSSIRSGVFEFNTSQAQMMAKAFGVSQDRVATFMVKLQLTQAEACMSDTELQGSIRETMNDHLFHASTPFHTVQITRMTVDRAGVQCRSNSTRTPLSDFSEATAEATMLVVFEEGGNSVIALEDLANQAGVLSVTPLSMSPKVATSKDWWLRTPPPSDWWLRTPPPSSDSSSYSSSFSSNVAIIAGAAAGGTVVLMATIAGT